MLSIGSCGPLLEYRKEGESPCAVANWPSALAQNSRTHNSHAQTTHTNIPSSLSRAANLHLFVVGRNRL